VPDKGKRVNTPAVRVDGLGKRYRLGERQPYRSLRETFTTAVSRRFRGESNGARETIWALRNVSFEVERGEVIGIVGRNGAGKSTLLKILARITEPSEGRVEVYGRVGSLLEIGTGFHPELTGRENVYLYGAILGMKKAEIGRKFDDIVAFSEIGGFLDTPVKHYSSGMHVRLAFAVASHVEPDLLLVDEVLAVGDAAFQRKCLRRLNQLRRTGCTALLVSHDLNAVRGLCSKSLWIDGGELRACGPTLDVTQQYRDFLLFQNGESGRPKPQRPSASPLDAEAAIARVTLLSGDGEPCAVFEPGRPLRVVVTYRSERPLVRPLIGVGIERCDGVICYGCSSETDGVELPELDGEGEVEIEFPALVLLPNQYRVTAGIWDQDSHTQLDALLDAAPFQVRSGLTNPGIVALAHRWHVARGEGRREPSNS
jgi:lipopolysaccharide transport system ATP-binding protein